MTMSYLFIDTSVRVGAVYLIDGQGGLVATRTLSAANHERLLSTTVADFLSQVPSRVVTILLSHGPGSYTGLRISSAFVAGLGVGGVTEQVITFDSRLLHGLTQLLEQPAQPSLVVGLETRRDEFVGLHIERDGAHGIQLHEQVIERREDPRVWWMQQTDRPVSDRAVWWAFTADVGVRHQPDKLPAPFYGGTVSAKTKAERGR